MKHIVKYSGLTGGLLIAIAMLFAVNSSFATDALRIQPTKQDFGTVDEGVPVIMLSIVENVGSQDVNISNVRIN